MTIPHDGNTFPARRLILAHSWWIASELVRRHPELVSLELHPGDGMYDVLALSTQPLETSAFRIMLNREGTLQVHSSDPSAKPGLPAIHTWPQVMGAEDAHAAVKSLEAAAGMSSPHRSPASTPKGLAYRFIATTLAMASNDRSAWDARTATDYPGWWPADDAWPHLLAAFPTALLEFRSMGSEQQTVPGAFWVIFKDRDPVAVVSASGSVHRRDTAHDLARLYDVHGRRMSPLVANLLGDVLP